MAPCCWVPTPKRERRARRPCLKMKSAIMTGGFVMTPLITSSGRRGYTRRNVPSVGFQGLFTAGITLKITAMSNTTCAISSAAAVLQEEGQRVAALAPVITRGQLTASVEQMRFALAKLQSYVSLLPREHPAAPVPEHSGERVGP